MKRQAKLKKLRPISPRGFRIYLDDGFVIIVEYWSRRGEMLRFAAVLIRLLDTDDGSEEVCRYDTAHDFAHLDILDRKRRVIDKIILPYAGYKKALQYAIHDFKTNYRTHWARFCGS
jgi:hypothetical protein